jgi:glutamate receptor, ionotropic, plant
LICKLLFNPQISSNFFLILPKSKTAVDLLNNQVEAIIGPMTSAQTEFVAYLCNRSRVPLISYSATSPAISPAHLPYFIRATLNDSSQSISIAAFIQHFGWRAVVPIYEDSDYGSGILPSLIDALQPIDTRIPDRAVIPTTVTNDYIEKELNRLATLPTRVFLVHMLPDLAIRLFKLAHKLNMMSDEYVWMVTDGVATVLETLNTTEINSMQGIIGFRPYVPKSDEISNFSARFKARFQKDYPGIDMTEPTIYQFRAYDVAWLLAKAVEMANVTTPTFAMPQGGNGPTTILDRLGVSQRGPRLLDTIHNTTFNGLAGNFSLVDGQLQLSAYEIVNIAENGPINVGFWTLSGGLTSELSDTLGGSKNSNKLKPILWSGDRDQVPRGWLIPTKGKKLKIAVPVKHGFFQFVNVSQPVTNASNITGYCIDVFNAVMKKLPYHVEYQYMPYKDSSYSYDNLVYQVYLQVIFC